MKRLLLGCGIIQKELTEALEKYEFDNLDIIWMEAGLHGEPKDLNRALQEKIDESEGYDEVILGYGLCGNALLGIEATHCDILYPKEHDCINAFMCGNCRAQELRRDSYFFSRGWLEMRTDDSLTHQYDKLLEKYDEEEAEFLMSVMYGNYKRLVYLKIEDEIAPEDLRKAQGYADAMNFEFVIEPASIILYEKLILGDESFPGVARLPKGEVLTLQHFMN